jgi:hypothetical protein
VILNDKGEKHEAIGWESKNPYFEGQKYLEPTDCTRFGLIYRTGRWHVAERPP